MHFQFSIHALINTAHLKSATLVIDCNKYSNSSIAIMQSCIQGQCCCTMQLQNIPSLVVTLDLLFIQLVTAFHSAAEYLAVTLNLSNHCCSIICSQWPLTQSCNGNSLWFAFVCLFSAPSITICSLSYLNEGVAAGERKRRQEERCWRETGEERRSGDWSKMSKLRGRTQ